MRSSWLLIITIGIVAVFYLFRFDFWKNDLVIRSDGFAYYGYIQGALLHHDPMNTFHGDLEGSALNRSWMHEGLPGRYLPKMTMGLAYAWVPGFYAADAVAGVLDYPQDGWSRPYQLAVGFTGIAFLIIGMLALWKVLIRRFSSAVVGITLLTLYLGTNLLQYASVDNSLSHVYSFGLGSLFLLFSDRWVNRCKTRDLLLSAFFLGWLVLIRPTNIVLGLYLLFALYEREGSLGRVFRIDTLWAALVAFLPIAPQLLFWKLTAGEWVHYSYEQEAFYWLNPHIMEGLFSYRNGWLVYTPIMGFALLGVWMLRKQSKWLVMAITGITILHVYVTFSWWCWYYGGSLSIRPMIDIYPLLAFGLAAFVAWTLRRPTWTWLVIGPLICVLIWNNLLQVKYANLGVITDSTMTKEAFWATWMNPEQPKYLSFAGVYRDPDTEHLRQGLAERLEFDTTFYAPIAKLDLDQSEKGPELNGERGFSDMLGITGDLLPSDPNALIMIRMGVSCGDPDRNGLHAVASFQHDDLNYQYQAANMTDLGLGVDERTVIKLFTKRPTYFPDEGVLQVYGYMTGKGNSKVHSIEVIPISVKRKELQ
ncbi:MAG: glycosyltransferase family 39 protein [Flavobacteriales bacterium]|nr:glycosyltransferase family 39 protein [Flavobacteriales bacterium]